MWLTWLLGPQPGSVLKNRQEGVQISFRLTRFIMKPAKDTEGVTLKYTQNLTREIENKKVLGMGDRVNSDFFFIWKKIQEKTFWDEEMMDLISEVLAWRSSWDIQVRRFGIGFWKYKTGGNDTDWRVTHILVAVHVDSVRTCRRTEDIKAKNLKNTTNTRIIMMDLIFSTAWGSFIHFQKPFFMS